MCSLERGEESCWDLPGLTSHSVNKNIQNGLSLVVQWLGLHAFNAGGMDSVPHQESFACHGVWSKII